MKFKDIGHAIRKRSWMIVGILLLALLAAAIVTKIQSPVYKVEIAVSATAPINPTTKLPDALTQGAYVALMPSIANFTESLGVAEAVSRRLSQEGMEIPPEELLKKVSAVPEPNSTSVKITFTDGSPTRVADIANAWGETLVLKTLRSEANEFYDESFKTLILNGNMVFTNRAVPPAKPTQPKPAAYLGLGAFLGMVLGLGLAVLLEFFDPHFRSPSEAEEILGLPVLGVIPREKKDRALKLLPFFGEGSPTWEAYSELRSGLILTRRGEPPRSVLVVPAIPFEAGPAVAANLAVSIANTERDTLLIDCDLREGALTRLLKADGKPGLAEALEGQGDLRKRVTATPIANLSLLPAGGRRENSTDLLSLAAFQENLRELEEIYDQVVLYAPPLVGSMDSAVVAAQAQACLVLIDAGLCTREVADQAMHSLRLLGIVPTGIALVNVKVKGREGRRATVREGREVPALKAANARVKGELKTMEGGKLEAGKEKTMPTTPKGRISPSVKAGEITPAEELSRVRSKIIEDFRRMGETGAPIPKNWLRALNSEKPDVRESATAAITAYYHAFLRRYRISEENVVRIADTIIKMMRREDVFAGMNEAEAQRHLEAMLIEAGAKFSPRGKETPGESGDGGPGEATRAPVSIEVTGELKRKEKRRLRIQRGEKSPERSRSGEMGSEEEGAAAEEEEIDWE